MRVCKRCAVALVAVLGLWGVAAAESALQGGVSNVRPDPVAVVDTSANADQSFAIGTYARVTKSPNFLNGNREWGVLKITARKPDSATFSLEVTWNPYVDDDGYHTNSGEVDSGNLSINGSYGVYRSAYEADDKLGTCILAFSVEHNDIVIKQDGTCWWFGYNVNASGIYRRTNNPPEAIPHVR